MPANPAGAIIAAGAVEHLHRLALSGRMEEQHRLLHDLYEQSVPIRSLMEDVVVPVANEIGRAWVDDEMSFAEVTLTIGRMQSAVATFTAATLEARGEAGTPPILLAPVPGEQHVFGAAVLGNLLSAEGYETETMLEAGADELCGRLSARDYAAIGLSCNSDRTLRLLPALIVELRSASKNKDIKILLGGWAFNEEDESLHSLGADLIVTDRRSAVEDIVKLVDLGP